MSWNIIAASLVVTSCVIANAFRQKHQFYPSVVYISKSSLSLYVLYLQVLVAVYLFCKLTSPILLGLLRVTDRLCLTNRLLRALLKLCVVFTTIENFKNIWTKYLAVVTCLLFLKCSHWLIEDLMKNMPFVSYWSIVRTQFLLIVLTLEDIYLVNWAYTNTNANVKLILGGEFVFLTILAAITAFKHVLHTIDISSNAVMAFKILALLYLEVIIEFIKCLKNMSFLLIITERNFLPLTNLPEVYLSIRNFLNAYDELTLTHTFIHNKNTVYSDATIQDLETMCLICREDMTVAAAIKLSCCHVFHTLCLYNWFLRHQTCPACRSDILHSTSLTPTTSDDEDWSSSSSDGYSWSSEETE